MPERSAPPFRADQVGSLLRSPALLAARAAHKRGESDAATLTRAEDAAIRDVVRLQEKLGVKAVTDGEFRRGSWHRDFDNVEIVPPTVKMRFHTEDGDIERTPSGLRVSGSLARPRLVPVTTNKGKLESKDELKRRIDAAARYVPLDQLALSPQCSFSSTVDGNLITLEAEISKLRLVVETARAVWG